MREERPSATAIERIQREARRLDVATSIPQYVLAPLLSDVASRQSDDAIVVIDPTERPSLSGVPDVSSALVAIVRREVLHEALGKNVMALSIARAGHVPFVVIDRYGTTVVFIEMGPPLNAPGGAA
jgi:hypothetical protein